MVLVNRVSGAISVPVTCIEITPSRVTLSEIGDEGVKPRHLSCVWPRYPGRPDRGRSDMYRWKGDIVQREDASCSLTESLRRDNDDRRHILVYKEKVQLLEDKR